ncbi:MAG: exodeoxyribonuclease V subunit beta [Polyangiaceae bacterium]|nr:exodeoxyribonuclease V subunit beta [Polyangiaceae bacterium]
MKVLDPLQVPLFGTELIEASAGTGKTHTITTLYLRLLLERKLSVEQILVVTFTEAATFELRARIRKRLRSAFDVLSADESAQSAEDPEILQIAADIPREDATRRLRLALATLDAAQVFTIHGFCQRVLGEYAFESGLRFDLKLSADVRPLLTELVQDFWTRELFEASEAEVQYLKQSHTDLLDLIQLARTVAGFPNIQVVPAPSGRGTPDALSAFVAARARFAEVWAQERDRVEQLLLTTTALSRTTYKLDSIGSWLEQLDGLAKETRVTLHGWFDKVENFGSRVLAEKTNKNKITPQNPAFGAIQELVDAYKIAAQSLEEWRRRCVAKLVEYVRSEFPKRKELAGVQSFDDLLNQLHAAVTSDAGVALARSIEERYPAALIDEFQDTDPTQYAIFRRIYSNTPGEPKERPKSTLFLIGDPKQAIYAFRGADIFAYLKAARDAEPNTYTLATNFRSDPSLVEAVNTVFEGVQNPFIFEDIRYVHVAARPGATDKLTLNGQRLPPVELQFLGRNVLNPRSAKPGQALSKHWSETTLPALVAREISASLKSGAKIGERGVRPGDIAVLTRTNRQALLVQAELRALGVASVLHGDTSVFDAPEARELGFVLRAVAEPNSQRAVRVALATTLFGQTADDLFALEQDEAGWERWVEDFHRWNETWQRRGVFQMLRQVLTECRAHERILAWIDGERRLTNLLHLGELLHSQACSQHLGVSGVLQWFDEMRHDRGSRDGIAPEAQQIRLESDALAVQLTTVHRSKGLEYPIVYCPYLWDGTLLFATEEQQLIYHEPENVEEVKLDVRATDEKEEVKALAEREKLAENLRLLYVALTRAKHRVVVAWGAVGTDFRYSALGYILHSQRGDFLATPDTVAARLKGLTDQEMLQELNALCVRSGGSVAVAELHPGPAEPYVSFEAPRQTGEALKLSRVLASHFRSSSFSGLTKGASVRLAPTVELGRDWDDEGEAPSAVVSASGTGGLVTLEQFPRGARPGTLLHSVLENLDFSEVAPDKIQAVAAPFLELTGLSTVALGPALGRGLSEVLQTPLLDSPNTLTLAKLDQKKRLNELEFTLPVHAEGQRRLTPRDLASVLELGAGKNAPIPKHYPSELGRLNFVPLEGFLRGFIDLVFEHEGLFYVADYKSNYLGPRYRDYSADELKGAMADHHYYLQYHLYTLALHRYLRQKLRGYSYERHFGGVFYLFLRGMSPINANKTGVFFDRPEERLVSALDDLFGQVSSAPIQVQP